MSKFALLYLFIVVAVVNSQRFENEVCKRVNDPWICLKLSKCPPAVAAIKRGETPEICSFTGNEPIVCCPPSNSGAVTPSFVTTRPSQPMTRPPPTGNAQASKVAWKKCQEYAKYVFVEEFSPVLLPFEDPTPKKEDYCGLIEEALVVGGEDAKEREFPHMAQIGYGEQSKIGWLCGGSLISERFILSAAHCTTPSSRWGPARWAKLGDLDTSTEGDDAKPVIIKIVQRLDHPDYSKTTLYNDLALYKLDRDVELNPYIRPICLHTEWKIQDATAIASGWGHTTWGGKSSPILQKVRLNFVTVESCNTTYRASIGRQIPRGILRDSMLCAGDEEGKDTCQGDSGGPLQRRLYNPYCMYAQVGVTSFGKYCGQNYPGVYTRVSHFLPWIVQNVWPNERA